MMSFLITILLITFSVQSSISSSSSAGGAGSGSTNEDIVEANEKSVAYAREKLRARIDALKLRNIRSHSGSVDFDHSHSEWNGLLKENVILIRNGQATKINYAKFDRAKLASYIERIESVSRQQFELWSREQKLAFYLNAYNALTVKLILERYPNVKSIKEFGTFFKSPWKYKFFTLFGEKHTLDEIEHEFVRSSADFDEPRVHFGFVCAAIGCPGILNEAFVPERVRIQLQKSMENFLQDRERNFIKGNVVFVSKIFKWYREDFEQGHQGYSSLKQYLDKNKRFIADNKEQLRVLEGKSYKIHWTDYDWSLNDFKED